MYNEGSNYCVTEPSKPSQSFKREGGHDDSCSGDNIYCIPTSDGVSAWGYYKFCPCYDNITEASTDPSLSPTLHPSIKPNVGVLKPSLSPTKLANSIRHPTFKPPFKSISRPSKRPTTAPSRQPRTKAPKTGKPTRKSKG